MIYSDLTVPGAVVVREDPFPYDDWTAMQLRLTYQGRLYGANSNNTRARHKHELRKCFHHQLKRFWDIHPDLKDIRPTTYMLPIDVNSRKDDHLPIIPFLAGRFAINGYNFVPLVVENWSLHCAIHVLILRPDLPGTVIRSGDLDNRLKTIFDALRIPVSADELGGYDTPEGNERPFFCLLQDDRLISHVSVEADILLQGVEDSIDENDARLVVKVDIKPYRSTMVGLSFV